MQVYPIRGAPFCTTKIQEKLLKKLGTEKAFPFTFEVGHLTAAVVCVCVRCGSIFGIKYQLERAR